MAQTKARLEGELATLREQARQASEASARTLDADRDELARTRKAIAEAKESAVAERAGLAADIQRLKDEKARIARELKAVLGG